MKNFKNLLYVRTIWEPRDESTLLKKSLNKNKNSKMLLILFFVCLQGVGGMLLLVLLLEIL